jgi:hypothetical protein
VKFCGCILFCSFTILGLAFRVTSGLETNLNRLVSQLRDTDDTIRASAAKQIREQLAIDPKRRTRDAGREYWEERIAQVKIGMKHEDVVNLLPSLNMQSTADLLHNGPGSGDWHYSGWRLDHYWTFSILYTNPDRVRELPKLRGSAMEVWIDPPKDHSGRWTTWFVNGQKHRESFHSNGQLHGTLTVFHDNGKKLFEQHYENGECHGKDTGWNRDGSKSYEGHYVDGKQHGTWMHWHVNGKPHLRSQLKNGKRDGTTTHWFENGQMQYEQQYKDGKKHGTDRAWDKTGKLLWSRVHRDGETN